MNRRENQPTAWMTYPREGQTVRVDLDKPKVVFGRASNCDVPLTIKGISRAHFIIVREDGGWILNDLSSTNGTYVNRLLVSRHVLSDGDEITMGPPGLVPLGLTYRQSGPLQRGEPRAVIDEDDADSAPNIDVSISVVDYTLRSRGGTAAAAGDESSILRGVQQVLQESSSTMLRPGGRDPAWLIGLFSEMGTALLSSTDLDDMLNQVLDLVFREVPAERGSIWLTDVDAGTAVARVVRNEGSAAAGPMDISRTIVNEAVRARRALLVSDAIADSRFSAAMSIDQMNIRAAMCAPLYHDGKVLGFVYVDTHDQMERFQQPHLEILTALAVFAAVGIEKWRMQEAAERARQNRERARLRVQVLLEVAKSLSSELDTTSLIKTIMVRARELLTAERCSLFLIDHERGELRSKVVEGADEIRFPMHQGIAGHVATTGEVLNIPDAYQDPRFNPDIDVQTGYRTRSILCTPLRNKDGKVIGVTQIMNKAEGPFTGEDEEMMGAFSAQAAVALENAMLFQQTLEMRNYLESILESINHLVLTLDEDGRLVTANGDVVLIFGIEADAMRQTSYTAWFDNANAEFIASVTRVYQRPEPVFVADATMQAGSRTVSINYHVVPLLDFEAQQKGVVVVIEDITDEKRMLSTLGRHLGPEVARKVLHEEESRLRGERQDVAVLFSDIRGYTAMTESMDAADVVELLNEYFTLMVGAVDAEQGILDKYIGDAIMAVFGAPHAYTDYSARACRAALRMQTALVGFNVCRQDRCLPPLGIGIGISTGSVISGCIGSENRIEYTCIGDGVNTASRLESASKFYGVPILISEFTRREIGDEFLVRELDFVRVIGKQQPVRVYELLGVRDQSLPEIVTKLLPPFQAGLMAYRDREWSRALEQFQHAVELASDPPSRLYIQRCQHFSENPPSDAWDGVWDLSAK